MKLSMVTDLEAKHAKANDVRLVTQRSLRCGFGLCFANRDKLCLFHVPDGPFVGGCSSFKRMYIMSVQLGQRISGHLTADKPALPESLSIVHSILACWIA